MITAVDQGLEELLRATVPLPKDVADISFDPPDGTWGAQLSRITVNLFLFDVARSTLPPRPPTARSREDGRIERRPPLPLVRLSYMVSAWAGNMRDEHQVLGEAMGCFLRHELIPPEYLAADLVTSVQLSLSQREGRKPGELWSGLQAKLKPSFEIEATVAVDADWVLAPPVVSRVEGLAAPRRDLERVGAQSRRSAYSSSPSPAGDSLPRVVRQPGGALVSEGRPAAEG